MTIGPPQITPDNASTATLALYAFLPNFVRDADAANQYTFLSWLEGAGAQQQKIDDLCRDTEEGIGWSIIMDVGRCPNYALAWLAQCLGVRFPGSIVGTDPVSDQEMRAAILMHQGWFRGTPAAIAAAALSIIGSGSVKIIERYPDPYSFTLVYIDNDGSLDYSQLASIAPWYTSSGGTPNVTGLYPLYSNFPANTEVFITQAVLDATPGGLIATVVNGN